MKFKKRKWLKFDIITYFLGIITGILVVVLKVGSHPIMGWVIMTIALLSLTITLMRRIG